MIVSAHQSHFLPWLGYFDKIRRADLFVVVDHVQFERGDFQNRNRIMTRTGVQWLTLPLRQHSRSELILEKEIDDRLVGNVSWGEKITRTLHHAYGRAPFFDRYMPFLGETFAHPWTRMVDLNMHLLSFFLDQLEIATPVVKSSALRGVEGARSKMVLTMCKAAGASVYLSGSGGSREYLDVDMFEREGGEVRWQTFAHPRYPQFGQDDFAPRLAVLDLLFNAGPESAAILRQPVLSAPVLERTDLEDEARVA